MHNPAVFSLRSHQHSTGFSLIEMLVVVLVIMVLLGLALAIPKHEEREAHVRGAAEELAAVLRETRTRAMRENRSFAVVFNIENAPGSSGKILNNRSGGHWYRVLGSKGVSAGSWTSSMGDGDAELGNPPLFCPYMGGANPLYGEARPYLNTVSRCWVSEPHRLAKGKVRFLALTDQDNGDNYSPHNGTWYTATYPRPWFGWWDAGTKKLHAWGGYDPDLKMTTFRQSGWTRYSWSRAIVNGREASHSGFYYEGFEGEITGCINPADRMVSDDTDRNGSVSATERATPSYKIFTQGNSRPLINAAWMDFAILFRPDGSVVTEWFRFRQGFAAIFSSFGGGRPLGLDPYVLTYPDPVRDRGIGDMCNGHAGKDCFNKNTPYPMESPTQREATDYVDRTGYYWISLAPDVLDDESTFPNAEAALKAQMPLYRVGISPGGAVRVIRVRTTNYEGRVFDTTITGSDWENKNKVWGKAGAVWSFAQPTEPNYNNHALHNADGSPRGDPIVDVVMPEMMRDRKWWWFAP